MRSLPATSTVVPGDEIALSIGIEGTPGRLQVRLDVKSVLRRHGDDRAAGRLRHDRD